MKGWWKESQCTRYTWHLTRKKLHRPVEEAEVVAECSEYSVSEGLSWC